jgi:hypothetical protein
MSSDYHLTRSQRLEVYEKALSKYVLMKTNGLTEIDTAICPVLLYESGIVDPHWTPGGTTNYLHIIPETFPEFYKQRPSFLYSGKHKMRSNEYLDSGGIAIRKDFDGEYYDVIEKDFVYWFPLSDITSRIIVLQNCIDQIKRLL